MNIKNKRNGHLISVGTAAGDLRPDDITVIQRSFSSVYCIHPFYKDEFEFNEGDAIMAGIKIPKDEDTQPISWFELSIPEEEKKNGGGTL